RRTICPFAVLTSRFADCGILIFRSILAGELTGTRIVEIDKYLPLLSITIGERLRAAEPVLLTTTATDTKGLSQTSATTSPKRFSTWTRHWLGTSMRISSSGVLPKLELKERKSPGRVIRHKHSLRTFENIE